MISSSKDDVLFITDRGSSFCLPRSQVFVSNLDLTVYQQNKFPKFITMKNLQFGWLAYLLVYKKKQEELLNMLEIKLKCI